MALLDVLGISPQIFDKMKYYHKSFYLRNGIQKEKSFYYLREVLESRFYTSEEINTILKKYDISIHYFIVYSINKGRYFTSEDYMQALKLNSGLFIGKTKMSDSFFNVHYNELLKYVKFILGNFKKRNMISYKLIIDDIIQEAMLYIYQNCGDLEINFKNTEKCFNKIQFRTQLHLLKIIEENHKLNKNEVHYKDKIDFVQNTCNMDSEDIESPNSLYGNMLLFMRQGYSFSESLEMVSNLYKDLSNEEIMENIKQEANEVRLNK